MTEAICPSYDPALPGARAIGLGGVDPTRRTLRLVVLSETGEATQRACGSCAEGGCANWQQSRCRVADRLVEAMAPAAGEGDPGGSRPGTWRVEDCAIRSGCRWYAQHGDVACAACPYVIEERFYGQVPPLG